MVKHITATFTEEEYKTILGVLYSIGQSNISDFYKLYAESYVQTYSSEGVDGKEALFNLRDLLPEEMKEELVIASLMRISRILQGKEMSGNIIPPELEKATKELISLYPELAHMNMNEILDWVDEHPEIIEKVYEKGESRENVKELNKDRIKNCSSCNEPLTQITDELSASWFDEEKRAYRFFAFCSTPCKDNLWSKYSKSEVNNVRL